MNADAFTTHLRSLDPGQRYGFVRKVSPGRIEADGPLATFGDICEIGDGAGDTPAMLGEIVAVHDDRIVLVPLEQGRPVAPDARVVARASRALAPVGDGYSGRIADAMGQPMDKAGAILADAWAPIGGCDIQPLDRADKPKLLETGIRAIDGLLSLAQGQRIGIFAASGVGKTTLVQQLAEQVVCDHCVICLVGERGREVRQLWSKLGGGPTPERYTFIAATSDQSAPLRARAVWQALCVAELWRARGRHVLFILDSVTRFAMALRELGLAAGEPPTLRAYTPNVFATLPRLTERCGALNGAGAISAIMTVLSETDDVDDPISEVMKSLLDGHIILSRALAEQGHFPAIDVIKSVSRQSEGLRTSHHAQAARRAIALMATHDDARILIESGLYKNGVNSKLDEAIRERPALVSLLKQRQDERTPLNATLERLQSAVAGAHAHG